MNTYEKTGGWGADPKVKSFRLAGEPGRGPRDQSFSSFAAVPPRIILRWALLRLICSRN
jgi:hypothetical protein